MKVKLFNPGRKGFSPSGKLSRGRMVMVGSGLFGKLKSWASKLWSQNVRPQLTNLLDTTTNFAKKAPAQAASFAKQQIQSGARKLLGQQRADTLVDYTSRQLAPYANQANQWVSGQIDRGRQMIRDRAGVGLATNPVDIWSIHSPYVPHNTDSSKLKYDAIHVPAAKRRKSSKSSKSGNGFKNKHKKYRPKKKYHGGSRKSSRVLDKILQSI